MPEGVFVAGLASCIVLCISCCLSDLLHYVGLRCILLRCAALRCAVLRCAALCCAVLCCAALCCAVLCCAVPSDCGCVQTCLRKFSIAYWRTPEYNCIRALVTVSMGFVLGTLYWKVGHHRYVYRQMETRQTIVLLHPHHLCASIC